ncbi:hypothetical protein [Streptomyces sp. NPDC055210]
MNAALIAIAAQPANPVTVSLRPAEDRLDPADAMVDTFRRATERRLIAEDLQRWKGYADDLARDLEDRTREREDVYRERSQLLAWIAALHPSTSVITNSPDEDGRHLLYLTAGGWQMSWHIRPRDIDLFKHVALVDVTDVRAQWDGHGTVQKYERVRHHVRLLALDDLGSADGSLTAVMTGSREPFRFTDEDGDHLHIGIPASPSNGSPAVSFHSVTEPVHVPVERIEELISALRRLVAAQQ